MLRTVVVVAALLCMAQAHAQVAASATLASDYQFRGVSLSDGQPSAQLSIDYDQPASGWYEGGMMSTVRADARDAVQLLGYAGYARRLGADWSWDAGVRYSRFTGAESYAYTEAYAGLSYRQLTGRIYYAPDYFGFGAAALYAELDTSHALTQHWYLFGHVGCLRHGGDVASDHTSRFRTDMRGGLGLALAPWDIQLSWTAVRGARGYDLVYDYPAGADVRRSAWLLGVSYAW
ncbi:hypothetical protein IHE49_05745 [Rhodanobacter sp. 7MK24]|uniref:TorF family putative porin n=1 Tax=Rhodanobacter sp. 7MK24 TaxID=2775922 RepID=UPI001781F5D2|nr:hypothetical protein [Rhodanobacter sp. 7MK24]